VAVVVAVVVVAVVVAVVVVAVVVVAVVVAVVAVVEQQLLPPEQKLGLVQLHVLVVNAMDVMVIVQQKNAWLMI
jgi:hypothetical protein